ncbi:MAG: FAD-binding oxidoreductase, partial [Myxococcota bacterium]
MDQAFIAQLQAIAETRIDAEALETYGGDWTRVHERKAGAVVFPKSTESVAQIVRLCAASQVAIVPSGGRTGLAAGAVATQGELVLSLERLAFIGDVDAAGLTLHVGAGAITEAVHQHCEAQGLTWPVDFASKGSSQVGGNIATNAGGVKVIRYGLTRNWVLGLRVVTGTGEILELNRSLEKNNTGVDLRQLFIGSEGILGIITEATLKLAPLPGHQDVMLFAVQDLPGVVRLFEAARKAPFALSAFEMMTDRCLARLQRHRGVRPPLDVETPCYVLMEVEGERAALEGWLENALELVEDGTIAAGADQARHLWTLREGISESLSGTGLPHKNDISLPIAALPEFVTKLETRLRAEYPDFEVCLFGHIGDGNLHVNLMKPDDMAKDAFLERAHELDARMFELIAEYGGSISAEHGIGLLKKPWLSYSRSDAEIALMRALKATLD